MLTDALELAKQSATNKQPERLSWGTIEFQVINLENTISFWTNSLGLTVRDRGDQWAALGTVSKTLFVFRSGASLPVSAGFLGMYHVAIGVPDQNEFSRMLARLNTLRVPASPVDHLMSKAIYIIDPNGLEIEIAFETPERFGCFGDMSQGLVLYDADGQPHSGRSPLDIKAELSYANGAELQRVISDEAFLAHVHFKVANLDTAATWFEGIGFARNLMLPHFGFADMGAGASYTHRLAMNIWEGTNLTPPPDNMARMTQYTLHAHDTDVVPNTRNVEVSSDGYSTQDPSGIQMSIVPNTNR